MITYYYMYNRRDTTASVRIKVRSNTTQAFNMRIPSPYNTTNTRNTFPDTHTHTPLTVFGTFHHCCTDRFKIASRSLQDRFKTASEHLTCMYQSHTTLQTLTTRSRSPRLTLTVFGDIQLGFWLFFFNGSYHNFGGNLKEIFFKTNRKMTSLGSKILFWRPL